MRQRLLAIVIIAIGGLFWAPPILSHRWLNTSEPGFVASLLVPVLLIGCVYWLLVFKWRAGTFSISLSLLLGVWVSKPLILFLSELFRNWPDRGAVWLLLMGPMLTYISSAYDGTFLGLLIVSILLILAHLKFEKGRWLLSARWHL